MSKVPSLKYLNQDEAVKLDQELFNEYKFSVDQLMELAGLSCATAVAKVFPEYRGTNVLVICGPGNNGGDGLVAARHLAMFGFCPSIYYPKRTPKPLYDALLNQCVLNGISVLEDCPKEDVLNCHYALVVDALFGFSFKPPVREGLKPCLDAMINTNLPVCCVDVPSGWDVNAGPPKDQPHIKPKLLISLSAPKICSKYLEDSWHYLGGRFIPTALQKKYSLELPEYPGTEQVVVIP